MKRVVKKYILGEIKNYTMIIFGSIISSLSYVLFLLPSKISAGGVSGIAIITYHIFGIPMGWVVLALNIPLFIIGVKYLGKLFGARTLVGIVSTSVFVDLFNGVYFPFIKLPSMPVDDMIIRAVFGGIMLGIGIGIIFRARGSSGGTDIVAQVLGKYTSLTPGMVFLVVDSVIITISGILLGTINTGTTSTDANQWELILYSIITLFLSSKVVDIVLHGLSTTKTVQIISDKNQEIIEFIHKDMDRGATVFKAIGSYTNKERDVIFCVLSRKELTKLRDYLSRVDKNSFMIVNDAYQVLGYGFSKFENTTL